MLDICVNACLLKNITLAGKSVFMGIKIDFLTYVFRFGPMGILVNRTISDVIGRMLG